MLPFIYYQQPNNYYLLKTIFYPFLNLSIPQSFFKYEISIFIKNHDHCSDSELLFVGLFST